jgi:hypothetical protein
MFQQFMAMQATQAVPVPVVPVTLGAEVVKASVKSKAKAKPVAIAVTPAKTVKPAAIVKQGVHIHELSNSFFVYGEQAPAKLAEFFTRKPHLDRGFKEREITGLGIVKAYWFGGRQIDKIKKILAK